MEKEQLPPQSTPTQVAMSPMQSNSASYYVQTAAPSNQEYVASATFAESSQRGQIPPSPPSNPGPPHGRWRDDICNWPSNLWPSCGCLCVVFGAWLVAQIAHKTECAKFDSIISPYIILYIIITILSIFFGNVVFVVPLLIVFFTALVLRFHIIKRYNITQNGGCCEFLIGFFCCPCSISQSKTLSMSC